jgi:sRNA-binding carbon storage regulator CsrA
VFDGPGRVVVLSVSGDRVKLGFEGDRSVQVDRDEVVARIAIEGRKRKVNDGTDET